MRTRQLLSEHKQVLNEDARHELLRHATTLEEFLESQEQTHALPADSIALNALADAKESEVLLWQAVIVLEERLTKAESQIQAVTALYKSSQQELAVRQVLHRLNEKLLIRVAEKAEVDVQQLYDERITNIGKICRSKKYHKAWQQIQKEHEFSDNAEGFWTDLKECKEPFDKFVHEDSFADVKQISYEKLQNDVAKEVFVGDKAKFEPSFQFFLRVNKKLSDAMGYSLFSYPPPKKREKASGRW